MKKPYTIAVVCLIGITLFIKLGIANALFVFLLVGAIPGTSYSIPPAGMLFLAMIPAWLVFVRLMMSGTIQAKIKSLNTNSRQVSKKSLARKRLGRA